MIFYGLRDGVVIAGQNHVYPHVEKFPCFLGVIRPEYVAHDVVGMGFVDHFLVEIPLYEL